MSYAQKTLFSAKKGWKTNFWKNKPREVNEHAMPLGKIVLLFILPLGNPEIPIHYTSWDQVEQALLVL